MTNSGLISTTTLSHRLGVNLSASFLISIGCKPFYVDGRNHWWDEDDYLDICERLGNYFLKGGAYLE